MEAGMNEWQLPWTGQCRCGQTRFRIDQAPLLTMACHCTGCQRMSASAFSLSVAVPASGFTITAGEPVIGGLHGATRHYFCPHCMSWMFTRPDVAQHLVNVRATMLDKHAWFKPFMETWTSEKLPWATTGAVKSYAGIPAYEEFVEITQGFLEHGARP
jgi:hypothetical protein